MTVANTGTLQLWIPGNNTPASDVTFNLDPGTEDFTFVNLKFDDRTFVCLDPGDGLVYDLFVTDRFRKIDLGLDVRDGSGRQMFYETRLRFAGDPEDNE